MTELAVNRDELARIMSDIACAHADDPLTYCDARTLRERVLAVAKEPSTAVHPDCAATALAVMRDDVLRALGGVRYGQIPHEDGWEWHFRGDE